MPTMIVSSLDAMMPGFAAVSAVPDPTGLAPASFGLVRFTPAGEQAIDVSVDAAGQLRRRNLLNGAPQPWTAESTRVLLEALRNAPTTDVGSSVAGAPIVHRLDVVNAAALRAQKQELGSWWDSLRARGAGAAGARASAMPQLDSSIETIWLDSLLQPALDRSTSQVGAPALWNDGYTGAGVFVAVIDTGWMPPISTPSTQTKRRRCR
jgi:hypothetical protein